MVGAEGEGIVSGCEVSANSFADGRGRTRTRGCCEWTDIKFVISAKETLRGRSNKIESQYICRDPHANRVCMMKRPAVMCR